MDMILTVEMSVEEETNPVTRTGTEDIGTDLGIFKEFEDLNTDIEVTIKYNSNST